LIGLDTNVLIRFIMVDDAKQAEIATTYIEKELSQELPGYINLIVMCEVSWLLLRTYKLPKEVFLQIANSLLRKAQLVFEQEESILKALVIFGTVNADFHDILIGCLNAETGTHTTVSFDNTAVKRIDGFKKLE
jgi:predicted nucleic-acid-binding protein